MKEQKKPARFVSIVVRGEELVALDADGRVWFYDPNVAMWRWFPADRETEPDE